MAGTGSDPGSGGPGGMGGQEGLGQSRAPTAYLAFYLSIYLCIYLYILSICLYIRLCKLCWDSCVRGDKGTSTDSTTIFFLVKEFVCLELYCMVFIINDFVELI